jgi:hypothetical protein
MPLSNEQWNAPPAGGGDFYSHQIANSCRFNHAGYLNDARASDGSATTGTISFWFKRSAIGSAQFLMDAREDGNNYMRIQILADDTIEWQNETGAAMKFELETTQVFRDTSAWYHFVGVIDMTNGTQGNRVQMYINGERVTVFDVETYPADASQVTALNTSANLRLGNAVAATVPLDGYMAEMVVIDGTAQAVTDMGETKNGAWIPKDPSGLTFGDNGAYLKFENSAALGNDSSGNDNDFTVTGVAAHDQMLDTPTFNSDSNGGNFCTFNYTNKGSSNALAEGNLKSSGSAGGNVSGTMAHMTGKWYWEQCALTVNQYGPTFGIGQLNTTGAASAAGGEYYIITWQTAAGQIYGGGGYPEGMGTITLDQTGVDALSSGDVLGFFMDLDNRKLWISKNGTLLNSGDPEEGDNPQASWASTPKSQPFTMTTQNVGTGVGILNCGQDGTFAGNKTAGGNSDANGYGNFLYDISDHPSFLAMCTGNLPTPAANTAEDEGPYKYFTPKLYTGDGASTLAITGLQFQPDWTWIKNRDTTDAHMFFDSSRGVTERLTIDTAVEGTDADTLKSFTSDGFTVGADVKCNTNTEKYVSWNWKINGGTTSSETDGGINTTCQTDADRGISIIQYAGDGGSSDVTMEHNLGVKPEFLIMKDRDSNGNNNNWGSWHHTSGFGKYAYWNTTAAPAASGNGTVKAVTDTLITYARTSTSGGSQTRFENGDNFITYAFASKEGFSKFGTYEGNGAADGTFVYTGFAPALVITKSIDSTSSWHIFDNLREGYNVDNDELLVEATTAEGTADMVDLLSNGFKCRIATDPNVAESYIFLAWASNPFKFATAR